MFNDDDDGEPPSGGDWIKGPLSARSTPADLERYIGDQLRISIDSLRMQLEEDTDLNFKNRPRDRAAVLERARELLEPRIRADVEAMHARLLGSVQ